MLTRQKVSNEEEENTNDGKSRKIYNVDKTKSIK